MATKQYWQFIAKYGLEAVRIPKTIGIRSGDFGKSEMDHASGSGFSSVNWHVLDSLNAPGLVLRFPQEDDLAHLLGKREVFQYFGVPQYLVEQMLENEKDLVA